MKVVSKELLSKQMANYHLLDSHCKVERAWLTEEGLYCHIHGRTPRKAIVNQTTKCYEVTDVIHNYIKAHCQGRPCGKWRKTYVVDLLQALWLGKFATFELHELVKIPNALCSKLVLEALTDDGSDT
jgi:hypothetical protein